VTKASETQKKPRAFEGVRVLEFAALIAGPSCGKYLADHGADVVKIERFPLGDASRAYNRTGAPRSPMYMQQNAGKRSMCIDLKQPEGMEIARELVARADVVIEAFTPGVMDRLGLGYGDLKKLNPSIILCSISGFGQTGPNAKRPGYAHISHAMTGWLAMQFLHCDPPQVPRGPGIAIGDTTAGLTAFGAVSAALYRKAMTGEGDHIDISLFDSLFGSNDFSLQTYLTSGQVDVQYHPVHATRDGYITALVGPDHRSWQGTCAAMGQPELANDPRFSDAESLGLNMEEAAGIMQAWLQTMSSEDAERVLTANHVACGIVLTIDRAVSQPQVKARNMTVTVDDPVMGPVDQINSAFRYTNADSGVSAPAPTLGQHNADVLRRDLGYDEDDIHRLQEQGVLRSEDR
jgi:crotonobetainyl-CoA:carnitine CoA-transferase CaiB-like acyl-CoA transferase